MIWARPIRREVLPPRGHPRVRRARESVLLAVGILGATVMPHVVFLHSHLMQGRIPTSRTRAGAPRCFTSKRLDDRHRHEPGWPDQRRDAGHGRGDLQRHWLRGMWPRWKTPTRRSTPLLGPASSTVFAISLVASGLSASTVGTHGRPGDHAGLPAPHDPHLGPPPGHHPAGAASRSGIGLEPTSTLVISQVVLSFCLPVGADPAGAVHPPPRPDGRPGQSTAPRRHRRCASA